MHTLIVYVPESFDALLTSPAAPVTDASRRDFVITLLREFAALLEHPEIACELQSLNAAPDDEAVVH